MFRKREPHFVGFPHDRDKEVVQFSVILINYAKGLLEPACIRSTGKELSEAAIRWGDIADLGFETTVELGDTRFILLF